VAGEELSLRDLMYCMMVASANDAATVIAEHVGGTQDGFIAMMNKKAAELGCVGTHFSNVHGLHDENTYTTARDICRILDVALENPDFKAMFTTKSYIVPATNKTEEERQVETSNYMMSNAVVKKHLDPRVTGGKTGATDEAGRCLAATAEGGGMELMTIVMGAVPEYEEDGQVVKYFGSFEETAILLDYVLENYEYRQIFHEGQTVSQFPVENGTNSVVVRPDMTRSTVLPKDLDESKLTWIYGDTVSAVTAPVAQGQKLSTIQVWYGSKCLAQADLVAANAVPVWQVPTAPTIPTEQDSGGNWTVLLVICGILTGVAVLVIPILVICRVVGQMRQAARRRRRQMGRRRSR
jgi:D-alanyl-D-alanine carboxypeptidase (penicillin-binding protein 5/6)